MNNLFAYGTLMYEDEDPTHGIDIDKYLEETLPGKVKGTLYVVEGFPFLTLEGDDWVEGKLFKFKNLDPLLKKYDRIEGADKVNPFFERKIIEVKLEDGSEEKAHCYVGGDGLNESFAKPEYRVENGDWNNVKEDWE